MNKNDIIELAKTLGENASPQLRTYIYIEWAGWLIFVLSLLAALAVTWRKYIAQKDQNADGCFPLGFALAVVGFAAGITVLCFIPYSLHVLTTPELEAIKSLLESSRH
jgi:hypothetical protein